MRCANVEEPLTTFVHSAVEPPIMKLVILSRQFACPVEVSLPGRRFVSVADVLQRIQTAAMDRLRESEFRWTLRAADGTRASGCRTARIALKDGAIEPLRCVDTLGKETVLAGLRVDVGHAALRELSPRPWPKGTQETLHRRVDFLGEKTFLGGLRRDDDNALLRRLVPHPWAPGTAEALFLAAEFVSRDQIQLVLEMRARAENGEL